MSEQSAQYEEVRTIYDAVVEHACTSGFPVDGVAGDDLVQERRIIVWAEALGLYAVQKVHVWIEHLGSFASYDEAALFTQQEQEREAEETGDRPRSVL